MNDLSGAAAVTGAPARELIESGFALENADAPLLHRGLNLADIAHVIDLRGRKVVPEEAARQLLALLLDPVYTAKAFAVVLDFLDAGAGPIVFWHTGGLLAAAEHLGRGQ